MASSAVFVMDRAVDRLAHALGLDPAEIRRRNFVQADEMPYDTGQLYRDGQPLVYDTGNFPEALEKALEAIDYDTFRAEQDALRARGIYRGVGISSYIEGTGVGPYEGATVYVDASGGVVVATGACSQGQGHETTFAQLAADAIGVREAVEPPRATWSPSVTISHASSSDITFSRRLRSRAWVWCLSSKYDGATSPSLSRVLPKSHMNSHIRILALCCARTHPSCL